MVELFVGWVLGTTSYVQVSHWFGLFCYFSVASFKGYLRTFLVGRDGAGNKVSWL